MLSVLLLPVAGIFFSPAVVLYCCPIVRVVDAALISLDAVLVGVVGVVAVVVAAAAAVV